MMKRPCKLIVRRETLRVLLDRQDLKRAVGADAAQSGDPLAALMGGTDTHSGEAAGCPLL